MIVLLVDDSSTMRKIIREILGALKDVNFMEAGDGREALKVLDTGLRIDLAIIDWNMPNMDGITLVRKIREKNKRLPLMMVTTESEKERVVEALKAGVNNYAIKPFMDDTLLEKVKLTLKKAGIAA